MFWIAAWGLTAIAGAIVAGMLATAKNRGISQWMAWGFLLSPLAVLVLLLLPRYQGSRPRQPTLDELDRRDSFL